jgi:hypothetical protein
MNSLNSVTEISTLVVAGGNAIVIFLVARTALRDYSPFGSPTILAVGVAATAFFAVISLGPVIFIPYAVMALACLALFIVRFLMSQGIPRPGASAKKSRCDKRIQLVSGRSPHCKDQQAILPSTHPHNYEND